jgi:hypothetical protein
MLKNNLAKKLNKNPFSKKILLKMKTIYKKEKMKTIYKKMKTIYKKK